MGKITFEVTVRIAVLETGKAEKSIEIWDVATGTLAKDVTVIIL